MRKATFKDLASKKTAGYRISSSEAAHLPMGSLFLNKMGRWLVTTKLSMQEVTNKLDAHWSYSKKLKELKECVGEENVLSVAFNGHKYSSWRTREKLGKVPAVPALLSFYHTISNGVGDEYSSGTAKVGEEFEHYGKRYSCVFLRETRGSAECFATYRMLAVKLS